jgi:phytoene dehydrogenase-like protein
MSSYDAVIIGAGPNGLAAAIRLAQEGLKVKIFEAKESIGGGCRTAELTLPGFHHDICSAIHPLAAGSPFFRRLPLGEHGLEWINPPAALSHPFDNRTAILLNQSLHETGESITKLAYHESKINVKFKEVFQRLISSWMLLEEDFLGPFHIPSHPFKALSFGLKALLPAENFAKIYLKSSYERSFFAGLAAHSIMPLERPVTSAAGMVLAVLGFIYGWPIPRGGSQKIADALASYLLSLKGKIETSSEIKSIDDLPLSKAILFDLTPRQLIKIAGERLPEKYKRKLDRFRYGPGVFKIDYALSDPVPFTAKECFSAGAVHIGGTIDEISESEKIVWNGGHPEKPFVILVQQSLFDESRAPKGKHTVWVYCHVPNGSDVDMTERIERQIERFAPGFRETILAKNVITAEDFGKYNSNYIGGDINGGVHDLLQFFSRPVWSFSPYKTPAKGIYICSSSTPPGGGVHGMCGYHAAEKVIKDLFR